MAEDLSGVLPEERCKWLVVLMTMVLAFDVGHERVADAGGAMDANMIVKGTLKGASRISGRSEDSEFVCWYWRTSERRKMQKDHDVRQSKGFEDSRQQSKQGELGRGRRHGECQSECDGDWIGAVAREKWRDSEWNRIAPGV